MANIYEKIVYEINNLIKQEDIYPKYMESIAGGKNDYKISQVFTKKKYDNSWIDTIEDCIVALDTIVRNPRKFIVIEEDIVDISLARSISVESVKHLSQHTNLISSVDKKGMVIPSKILNTSKEESFDIYENRFIYTLLLKIRDFIDRRFTTIQNAMMQSGELGVSIESEFALDKNKVKYKLESDANFPFDEVVKRKTSGQPTDIERIAHIKGIISDFLASPFSKEMRSCALVRPPIQRTNVILKNPNFKKALVLWQFIETTENMDFTVDTATETSELPANLTDKYRGLIFLNTVLMQSIASTRDGTETVEEAEQRKKIEADQYVTKNIDDFVPDDFPQLKMDLSEIRRIYRRIAAGEPTLTLGEIGKMNGALDRVIRQVKINGAKEDGIRQQKLIAKQLEEEAAAKRLALREQKDLERKARQEEARRRIQLKKEDAEHKIRLKKLEEAAKKEAEQKEKEAREEARRQEEAHKTELARLENERAAIEEARRVEAARVAELRRIQDERIAEETRIAKEQKNAVDALFSKYSALEADAKNALDAAKKDYEDSIAAFNAEEKALEEERREHVKKMAETESEKIAEAQEAQMTERLIGEEKQAAAETERTKNDALAKMKADSEKYWSDEQKLATQLGIDLKLDVLHSYENKQRADILDKRRFSVDSMKRIAESFERGLAVNDYRTVDALISLARNNMSDEQITEIVREFDRRRKKRSVKWFINRLKKLTDNKNRK
jgi:chemotaxis protein histidine kinase CheA